MESVMIRVCCAIFKTSQNVEKNDPLYLLKKTNTAMCKEELRWNTRLIMNSATIMILKPLHSSHIGLMYDSKKPLIFSLLQYLKMLIFQVHINKL